jgi:AcrR family transcriptional regulator
MLRIGEGADCWNLLADRLVGQYVGVNSLEVELVRESRRQWIVEAAIGLMARGGPEALTASALAQAAGVSKANLFHHFATLDDIVLEAFEQFVAGLQSLKGPPPASLRDWLLGLGAEAAASMAEAPPLSRAYFAFVARALSDARLRQRSAEIADMAAVGFGQMIRIFRPTASQTEVEALAGLLLIAGDGLALHRGLFPAAAARQDAGWRALVDLIAPKEDR